VGDPAGLAASRLRERRSEGVGVTARLSRSTLRVAASARPAMRLPMLLERARLLNEAASPELPEPREPPLGSLGGTVEGCEVGDAMGANLATHALMYEKT